MSLINDALKKAQRQQADAPDHMPPMPGGGGGGERKRGTPMAAQTILLIAVGCVVLVAASIGTTIWLMRSKTPASVAATKPEATVTPKTSVTPPAPTAAATPVAVATTSTPPPASDEKPVPIVAVMPKPIMPVIPESKPEPTPVVPAPAPAPVATSTPASSSVATTSTSTASSTSAPVSDESSKPSRLASMKLALPDERVHAFLDALRVTGIRSSGNDSRVLMNDKVYRVNDIVERNLELRLTKVAADSLTFTDANGLVYVKNF